MTNTTPRLLSINEQRDAMLKYNGLASFGSGSDGIYHALLKAQDAKTYSLTTAEYQAKIKELFREIENYSYTLSWYDSIQAVESKYLQDK